MERKEIITGIKLFDMSINDMFNYFNDECGCSFEKEEFQNLYNSVKEA